MEQQGHITMINGRKRTREHVVYLQEITAWATYRNLTYQFERSVGSEVKYWSCGHFDIPTTSQAKPSYVSYINTKYKRLMGMSLDLQVFGHQPKLWMTFKDSNSNKICGFKECFRERQRRKNKVLDLNFKEENMI